MKQKNSSRNKELMKRDKGIKASRASTLSTAEIKPWVLAALWVVTEWKWLILCMVSRGKGWPASKGLVYVPRGKDFSCSMASKTCRQVGQQPWLCYSKRLVTRFKNTPPLLQPGPGNFNQTSQQSNKWAELPFGNWLFQVSEESSYFEGISQNILKYDLKYILLSDESLTNTHLRCGF